MERDRRADDRLSDSAIVPV